MRTCSIPGCGKKHDAKGLCPSHYAKASHATAAGIADTKAQNETPRALAARLAYSKTPASRRSKNAHMERRFRAFRDLMAALKGGPCADCLGIFPPCAMDFDHVRGIKLFDVSKGVSKTWLVLVEELAKCELVCSNCHRVRTSKRHGS